MPNHTVSRRSPNGFTLAELAIVLVIVGILLGAAFTMASFVRNAKLNSLMAETKAMSAAYNQFQTKYNAIPGDFVTASSTWSGAGNGDGNGAIRGSNTLPWPCNRDEWYYTFKHLALGGYITGSYTGVGAGGTGTYNARIGVNVPSTSMDRTTFLFDHPDAADGIVDAGADPYFFDGAWGNVIRIAAAFDDGTTEPNTGFIAAKQAFNIDDKYDDGMPGHGTVVTPKSSAMAGRCVNSNDPNSAAYIVATDAKDCILMVRIP